MKVNVKNMTSSNGNKVANQFIIDIFNGDEHHKIFQSYESIIIDIDYNNTSILVYDDFGYSRTTSKYTKLFLKEIFFDEFAEDVYKAINNKLSGCDNWRINYV